MQLKGKLDCITALRLVHSGAGLNVLSQEFVKRKTGYLWISWPMSMSVHQMVSLVLKLEHAKCMSESTCLAMVNVTCLADRFDVIFGEPWLLQHNSCLAYDDRCVVLKNGQKRMTL